MRLYSEVFLKEQSHDELHRKLAMVAVNDDLTLEERGKNIDLINFVLNGCVNNTRVDSHEDIKACQADLDGFEV